MKHDESQLANDPDLFSRELHRLLLTNGPKSKGVRRLMRTARKHPGAELERILETKINEFKRHQRETRLPTVWNAPERCLEWMADHVALTPPKDVVMTLVYVIIALLGVEAVKGRLLSQPAKFDTDGFSTSFASPGSESRSDSIETTGRISSEAIERVDNWLADQVVQAAQTDEFTAVLREQIQRQMAEIDLQDVLRQQIEKLDLHAEFSVQVDAYFRSPEFREHVIRSVAEALSQSPVIKDDAPKDRSDPTAKQPAESDTRATESDYDADPPKVTSAAGDQ